MLTEVEITGQARMLLGFRATDDCPEVDEAIATAYSIGYRGPRAIMYFVRQMLQMPPLES